MLRALFPLILLIISISSLPITRISIIFDKIQNLVASEILQEVMNKMGISPEQQVYAAGVWKFIVEEDFMKAGLEERMKMVQRFMENQL